MALFLPFLLRVCSSVHLVFFSSLLSIASLYQRELTPEEGSENVVQGRIFGRSGFLIRPGNIASDDSTGDICVDVRDVAFLRNKDALSQKRLVVKLSDPGKPDARLKKLAKAAQSRESVAKLRSLALEVGDAKRPGCLDGCVARYPVLFHALSHGVKYCKALLDVLLEFGGTANARSEDGTPLLLLVLGHVSPDIYDCTELVRYLLACGADPCATSRDGEPATVKCTNVSQRYWLMRAEQRQAGGRAGERLQTLGLQRMQGLDLSLVGERVASKVAAESIGGWVGLQSLKEEKDRQPLVLLFAGPPGHGKTVMAESVGRAIVQNPETDFLRINCGKDTTVEAMFGQSLAFKGGDSGSPLNNFLADDKKNKRKVVLLDEADFLARGGIAHAFRGPLENGVWLDSRNNESVRCTNTVFILTCNAADSAIVEYIQEKYGGGRHLHADFFSLNDAEIDKISYELNERVKQKLSRAAFDEAFLSRIQKVVPFLTFNEGEAAIVADALLRDYRELMRAPPSETDGFGGFTVNVHPDVCKAVRQQYKPTLGARSIQQVSVDRVNALVFSEWNSGRLRARTSVVDEEDAGSQCWITVTPTGQLHLSLTPPASIWRPLTLEEVGFVPRVKGQEEDVQDDDNAHNNDTGGGSGGDNDGDDDDNDVIDPSLLLKRERN